MSELDLLLGQAVVTGAVVNDDNEVVSPGSHQAKVAGDGVQWPGHKC